MKKSRPLLYLFIWFVLVLPAFRIVQSGITSRPAAFREYREGREELTFLAERENALFPDQFLSVESDWEYDRYDWKALWHVFRPYLDDSIKELDELDRNVPYKSSMSAGEFWAGVYTYVAEKNRTRIENIARGFLWYREKNRLSDRELLDLVVNFVQQIPYELPENEYGLYSPSMILERKGGDCDSKSLFAALLLEELGYDTALFYSRDYRHAMLGVNAPSTGVYKELDGSTYYFTEMTAPGWQIGDIPPDCSDPELWSVSRL